MGASDMTFLQDTCPWCHRAGWGGSASLFMGILVIALVAALVIVIVRGARRRQELHIHDEAEGALRELYERGEIDDETYQRRLRELRNR